MEKETAKKLAAEYAQVDWNNQCKRFMSGSIPFTDKSKKDCYERHLKSIERVLADSTL